MYIHMCFLQLRYFIKGKHYCDNACTIISYAKVLWALDYYTNYTNFPRALDSYTCYTNIPRALHSYTNSRNVPRALDKYTNFPGP